MLDSVLDTVFGLPTHVLVVHAAVVLIPLAAVAAAIFAVVPRWRRPLRWWVVLVTLAATAAVPVATETGQHLQRRLGEQGALTGGVATAVSTHAARGEQMKWFVIPLLVLVLLLVWLDMQRPSRPASAYGGPMVRSRQSLVLKIVAVLTLAAALATTVQVVRVGHSGSAAVWQPVVQQPR